MGRDGSEGRGGNFSSNFFRAIGSDSFRGEDVVVLETVVTLLDPATVNELAATETDTTDVTVLDLSFFLFKYSCKLT